MESRKVKFIRISSLLLIIAIGVYLRVLCMNRPGGLWYDELKTFAFAQHSLPWGIIHILMRNDLHCPLHYFYLHIWMNIFGTGDITLKMSSMVFGILTIPTAYLAGKELSDENGGLLTALFFSINSGLIYYSQEVRPYAALLFFSTLSILFLVRILKYDSKLNYIGLVISNLFIIYTFTIGFIFIIIESIIFFIYLRSIKQNTKSFLISNLILFVLCLPLVPLLVYFVIRHIHNTFYYFDYFEFKLTHFLAVINSIGGPLSPFFWTAFILKSDLVIWMSTIIFAIFIIKAIKNNKIALTMFLIGLIPLLLGLMLALFDKFTFMYNHNILSIPFFLIAASLGVLKFKNKFVTNTLLSFYLFINLGYLLFSPNSVLFMIRAHGFKYVEEGLNKLHATNQDVFVSLPWGGDETILKYDYKARMLPLCFHDYNLNHGDTFKYIFDKSFIYTLNKDNVAGKMKTFILSSDATPSFKTYIQHDVANMIPIGRYFYIIMPKFWYEELNKNTNPNEYKNRHIKELLTKKIANDTLSILNNDNRFINFDIMNFNDWTFIIFQKTK